jgi:DNA-binding winged helix-turn-helix (wHTH) protein/predicted Zn-dependent protease
LQEAAFPYNEQTSRVYQMQNEQVANVVRFGSFELDTSSGELTGSDGKIPLQDQPFQILKLLTERPGEVVTREEIRRQLWPDDTVVEFENAVNAAIKKLRIALGDSAEEPRYVETLRRRGYRLMVPVEQPLEVGTAGEVGETAAATTESDPRLESSLTPTPTRGAENATTGRGRMMVPVAVALLVIFGIVYGYSRRPIHANAKLTDRDRIVLADFANKTDDPVFSETLRQGLTVQLDQSPFLSLVSEERIQQVLGLMGQPVSTGLTPLVALEVCQRTGSTAVLEGSIASLGSQYVLWLRAVNCRTGEVIDEEQMQAARKEDVLNTLSQIASRFRSRAGEGLTMVDKLDTPLAEATTPSLEALKAYSMAWKVVYTTGDAAAVPFFKRAIEIDPQFAMAYAMLGRVYGDIAESELSAENTTKAWQLRDRANDWERFFIDSSYETQVTGNAEKAREISEAWEQTYPREAKAHGFLAGSIYPMLGRYEPALEESRKMVDQDPDFPVGYNLLALSYVALGRMEEASKTLQEASDRNLQMPDLVVDRYEIAFLKNDEVGMEKAVALAAKTPGAEDLVANQESFGAAYSGHLQQARKRSGFAVQLAEQAGQRERAALFQSGAAVREGFFGNSAAARQSGKTALALSKGKEVEYGAAFAEGLADDAGAAQTMADDLERRFPDDTSAKYYYVPALRALAALNHHNPAKAVEWLQINIPYELGEPESCFYGFFGVMYPVYVRGEAYLALHQGALAAAEFQKIVDHRGIVISDPVGALARLQLGRAYLMAGDQAKAKAAYSDFLDLWKDADSNIPVLQQARLEYARLE